MSHEALGHQFGDMTHVYLEHIDEQHTRTSEDIKRSSAAYTKYHPQHAEAIAQHHEHIQGQLGELREIASMNVRTTTGNPMDVVHQHGRALPKGYGAWHRGAQRIIGAR